jgi:hypothetical protein
MKRPPAGGVDSGALYASRARLGARALGWLRDGVDDAALGALVRAAAAELANPAGNRAKIPEREAPPERLDDDPEPPPCGTSER